MCYYTFTFTKCANFIEFTRKHHGYDRLLISDTFQLMVYKQNAVQINSSRKSNLQLTVSFWGFYVYNKVSGCYSRIMKQKNASKTLLSFEMNFLSFWTQFHSHKDFVIKLFVLHFHLYTHNIKYDDFLCSLIVGF